MNATKNSDDNKPRVISWGLHEGRLLDEVGEYQVIHCESCQISHIVPIPEQPLVDGLYEQQYYAETKPDYIERHQQDLAWWRMVYNERLQWIENKIRDTGGCGSKQRRILDIGCGPGNFLLEANQRNWQTKGIEPARQAAEYAKKAGLDVFNGFFDENVIKQIGCFDVVNMSNVLEHVVDPKKMLEQVVSIIEPNGILCVVVPNDYNPIQQAVRSQVGLRPWWLVPPHHINYFTIPSLGGLVESVGMTTVFKETTFPIDWFLLMGDHYIDDDPLGRRCHERRIRFETHLENAGLGPLKQKLYAMMAELNIGREIVLYCQKLNWDRED